MPAPRTIRRPLVLGAVMAATFMIAIEATIVSTAMPQIAAQLGDLHLYSWVFSAFLLTQTATTMVFGKLADLYGRKPVLLAGVVVFLLGSVLCGTAWSMASLIVFRLVQGIGAGAIQPVCLTVVGDLYPGHERGRIQAYLSSVWGVSSVLGPLAGGLLTRYLGWSWVFWINVPIGVIAAAAFVAFLHEGVPHGERQVDGMGAALFAIAVAALMVALTEAGAHPAYPLAALAVCLVSSVLFVRAERRAADPMVDFGLWTRRPIATANAATLLSGMAIVGLTTFLPMYVQGVLDRTALLAGFTLTVMVLGWTFGAFFAARNFARFGLRGTLLFGSTLLPLGAVAFVLMSPQTPLPLAGAGSVVMGLGMGFLSTSAIVIVQSSVGWAERGAATAANIFSRSLGSTLGATVLGGLLNLGLAQGGSGETRVDYDQIRRMLEHPGLAGGDAAVRAALGEALHLTFCGVLLIGAATLVAALLVPRVALRAPAVLATAE